MIEISLARGQDIDGITKLEQEIFPDPWHYGSVESVIARPYVTTLAARENGSVVGYLVYYHIVNEGEIARIAVSASYRRRQIARRLLEEMIARGAQEGLTEYSLEVRESNRAAIALYESLSFHEEGRRKAYYRDPQEDGLIMWRRPGGSDTLYLR